VLRGQVGKAGGECFRQVPQVCSGAWCCVAEVARAVRWQQLQFARRRGVM